jgi:hypothetical protein
MDSIGTSARELFDELVGAFLVQFGSAVCESLCQLKSLRAGQFGNVVQIAIVERLPPTAKI